jgi:hypothetical protein
MWLPVFEVFLRQVVSIAQLILDYLEFIVETILFQVKAMGLLPQQVHRLFEIVNYFFAFSRAVVLVLVLFTFILIVTILLVLINHCG